MHSMQDKLDPIVKAAETGDLATIQTLDPDGINSVITQSEEWQELGATPLFALPIMVTSL